MSCRLSALTENECVPLAGHPGAQGQGTHSLWDVLTWQNLAGSREEHCLLVYQHHGFVTLGARGNLQGCFIPNPQCSQLENQHLERDRLCQGHASNQNPRPLAPLSPTDLLDKGNKNNEYKKPKGFLFGCLFSIFFFSEDTYSTNPNRRMAKRKKVCTAK